MLWAAGLLSWGNAVAGECDWPSVPDGNCGTAVLLEWAATAPEGCLPEPVRSAPAEGIWPSPGAKQVRNPYASTNRYETENFVIWWGDQGAVETPEIAEIAEWMEQSRASQEALGFPVPIGTDQYLSLIHI